MTNYIVGIETVLLLTLFIWCYKLTEEFNYIEEKIKNMGKYSHCLDKTLKELEKTLKNR